MNKFLYVFTVDLADKLLEEKFELHSLHKEGERYSVFVVKNEIPIEILRPYTAGTDYVFSDKLFF